MVSGRGSDAARQRADEALAARRRRTGWRPLYLWLPPAMVTAITAAAQKSGLSFSAAAKAALARGCGMTDDGDL